MQTKRMTNSGLTLSKNKDAYNEDTKKLFFDNTSFAYNPKKHASRKLQLAVLKRYYENVEKSMTKYGRKKWRGRQTNLQGQVQAYKELTSVKKLQEFYRKDVKVDAFQAEKTVLKGVPGC